MLRGVFRCFLRCTVSCYASLTEPVDTLCASTTSSSVVLSCRSLTLWQSMEGSGLGSDYLQIFVRLVQMIKCRYFYVLYKRLFANICTSVSGDHRHVPERRPWYVRSDHRGLRDLPRHASQLAPALSKHQRTVTVAESLLDIPFSFLTTPHTYPDMYKVTSQNHRLGQFLGGSIPQSVRHKHNSCLLFAPVGSSGHQRTQWI